MIAGFHDLFVSRNYFHRFVFGLKTSFEYRESGIKLRRLFQVGKPDIVSENNSPIIAGFLSGDDVQQ
ncbi:hypothetical protein SDC9_118914 [bioreactor metagenome]|uniref:Uncharacterized protein n=1 Tax=bioreactor metagenome TaxID=1076179 RepID=A0A645C2R9_9ZZZZ